MFAHWSSASVARGALLAQVLDRAIDDPVELVEDLLARRLAPAVVEQLGEERAARYLHKFHPWYLSRLGEPRSTLAELQCANRLEDQRVILRNLRYHAAPLASRAA